MCTPFSTSTSIQLCAKLSEIERNGLNFQVCVDLEVQITVYKLYKYRMHFVCLKFGWDGFKVFWPQQNVSNSIDTFDRPTVVTSPSTEITRRPTVITSHPTIITSPSTEISNQQAVVTSRPKVTTSRPKVTTSWPTVITSTENEIVSTTEQSWQSWWDSWNSKDWLANTE